MNDRFQILYKLDNNLYIKNSPIIISAGALLKDTKTDSIIAQLKFQSISNRKIIALKITIDAFDISGNSVTGIDEYQYLDLNINNGDFFGNNKAIIMPDRVTRIIKIEKITIIFETGEQVFTGEDFKPLPHQDSLTTTLSSDLIKQYQIDVSTVCKYVPTTIDDIWLCSCGTPNSANTCAQCGATKENVFSSYNQTVLTEHFQMRLAHQQEIAENKQKQEAAEKAKQKKRVKLFIAFGIAVVLLLVAILSINAVKEQKAYNALLAEIDSYVDQERYEEAFDKINTLDISYDDKTIYREMLIPYMQKKHQEARDRLEDDLAFCLNNTCFYVADYEIYSVNNDEKILLYEAPDSGKILGSYRYYYLGTRRSIYSNGCLFFVECCERDDLNTGKTSYTYTAKYIALSSGEVKYLYSDDSYSDIYKLENGSIFIGFNILNPNEGVLYNPYTQTKYTGDDIVLDWQLEGAISKN